LSYYKPNFLKSLFHKARRILAKNWVRFIKPKIIAVTGSQGKTGTRTILASLFPDAVVTDLSLDTIYNVPITALKFRRKDQVGIFELGIDRIGEMETHLEIVKPNISIVTGISAVHSDPELLGSIENIIKEKRKIIEGLSADDFAILNFDDENVRGMADYTKAKVFFFGSDEKRCKVFARTKTGNVAKSVKDLDAVVLLSGTKFSIFDSGKEIKLETSLIGKHHIYNVLASYLAFKVFHEMILKDSDSVVENESLLRFFVQKISELKPTPGRMSFEKIGDFNILNDSLRSNPKSCEAGIETVSEIKTSGKKFLVLAEMGELGHYSEMEHRKIGSLVAKSNVDYLISTGPLQKFTYEESIKNGFPSKKAFYAENVLDAFEILKSLVQDGDLIYLKGSLLRHLERILILLDGKPVNCKLVVCNLYKKCIECEFLNKKQK